MTSDRDRSFDRLCSTARTRVKERWTHRYLAGYWPDVIGIDDLDPAGLRALQQARLRALLEHVTVHVPFFVRWFRESGFTSVDEISLNSLPVLQKEHYRRSVDDFQSSAYPLSEMRTLRTSGSSGEPFHFRRHASSIDHSYACMWRALLRHGIRPGDRRGYIWGRSERVSMDPWAARKVRMRHIARDWFNNAVSFDAYVLSPERLGGMARRLERFGPAYLHGYVSAIYSLARYLLDSGRDFHHLRLRAVVTEAERLYPFQAEVIRKAFGCPIVEGYGSVEVGPVAYTHPCGEMLVSDDGSILEVLPNGELLVTDLFSHAFPFIRYRLGDLVDLAGSNGCGLPYTRLKSVVGRTVDMIPLPGGGSVHGVALAHVIDPYLNVVSKYQVHQVALGRFDVRLVMASNGSREAVKAQIAQRFREFLGDVVVNVEDVEAIEPGPSGKFHWVRSSLSRTGSSTPGGEEAAGDRAS